jgi:glycine cleavage system aminomethyltransferase T
MMRHGDSSALETCPLSIELQRTPLHALHQALGGRLVAFAGYEMPVQYPAGLMAEHRHTRASASLFDVSDMGQLFISCAGASLALESLMPVDVLDLGVDQAMAMAYVPPALAAVGTKLQAMVRGKAVPMAVTALPFLAPRYFRG